MMALTRRARGGINNAIDNPQDLGLLAAIGASQRVIRIMSPNLNDDAVKDALLDALARGVTVQLVLSRGFNEKAENLPNQGGGNQANADELYARALQRVGEDAACERLQIRWYVDPDLGLVDGNGEGAAHLKYTSFDDQLVVVGSTNMDTQSWNFSGEANVAIDDRATTTRYDAEVFTPHFDRARATGHCGHF